MALGYRGNPAWRDMSEYVVHFTPDRESLVAIMAGERIEARTPFGWNRDADRQDNLPTQKSVCLSEVPLDLLDRLVERHGSWGLGFKKADLAMDGAVPVWYVEKDTRAARNINIVGSHVPPEAEQAWYELTRYIDKVGEFPDGSVYRFEWEREWRVPRRLDLWPGGPAFLFAPERQHDRLTRALEDLGTPSLRRGIPPIFDPLWSDDVIQEAMAAADV